MPKLKVNSCDGIYDTSLDVRFTKACDNNCSFCIEKGGLDSLAKKPNIEKMVESTISSNKEVVLILGGEPYLYPNELQAYTQAIRPHVKEIYITTSVPKTFETEKELIRSIFDNIDCLNVSLQHYDKSVNNSILEAKSNHDRLKILADLNKEGFAEKIRVSINLVKGYIDSKEELIKFLDLLYSIGCKQVKINELQHTPELYVSFEEMFNVELPSPYAFGCQKEVPRKVLNYAGMKIILKRACFMVEQSRTATIEDYEKVLMQSSHTKENGMLVLYENGKLSNGWLSKGCEGYVNEVDEGD